ncbi:MAG: 4-hydroxy-tetrahydrodipicolinate synthase [Oscillospiraceae bacterium]|jgi:4-hydroxy-tetrahydrodipicolinate synthase|nr:4-hydroxy-tetrahydrodipicolinate synthase [Oscillospiraceae bacterium]
MSNPIFSGSAVAIVTPFDNAGEVNYVKFGELIDEQIAGGTAAIVVCGTTGESATQTLEEHSKTVDFAIKHVNHRVPVIAGAGSNDTAAALFLCEHAQHSGADALLLVTPYYNKTSQRGLIKHYTYLADAVDIPIILYNVPARTGVDIAPETYAALAKHKMIAGTKEASGNIGNLSRTLKLTENDDFDVWSGDDAYTLPLIAMGAIGVISVLANIYPRVMADLCEAALKGDFAKARELHYNALEAMNAMMYDVNPIPVKTAMNLLGKDVGQLRMPLTDMDEATLERLKKALDGARTQNFR